MPTIRRRRRNPRETAARRRFVAGLFLFLLALAAAIYFGAADYLPPLEPVPASASLTPATVGVQPAVAAGELERAIYPYSIIDGGAPSVEELKNAMARDPVVAAHYADFAIERARVERLSQPRLAHVSYRIGNSVFWTRKPIALGAGEQVLTDGEHIARTRCGNQLADKPGEVSPMEPPAGVLDTPVTSRPAAAAPLALLHSPMTFPTGLGGVSGPGSGGSVPWGGAPGLGGLGGLLVGGGAGSSGATEHDPAVPENPPTPAENPTGPPEPPGLPPAPPGPGQAKVPPASIPAIPGPTVPIGSEPWPSPPGGPGEWTPPGGPNPGDVPGAGGPGTPVNPPGGGDQEPVTVPEPGSTLLLAGGAAYALRRMRNRRG